jgi:gag-polyprotein putative aspartyl protease
MGSFAATRVARVVVFLLLILTPLLNGARTSEYKIPFRTVQSMIVVDGTVNGNRATLLLDTGANRTIINAKAYGNVQFELQRLPQNSRGPGLTGGSLRLPADLVLAGHVRITQRVSVMDLEELKQMLKMDFDGLLGQDILRQFRAVRIDYRAHVIELDE